MLRVKRHSSLLSTASQRASETSERIELLYPASLLRNLKGFLSADLSTRKPYRFVPLAEESVIAPDRYPDSPIES